MNNTEIACEQFRAARNSLGLSQRFIAKETGINRSQLALFEIGKYNLEAFKRLALLHCYLRLGHKFTDMPSAPTLGIQAALPISTQKPKGAEGNKAAQSPRIIDGMLISSGIANSDIDSITNEINSNDIIIKRLAGTSVDLSLFSREPLTNEHETIIRLMARNYQLMRSLQGRAVFPEESRDSAKNSSPRQKTAADLAVAVLISEIEQPENR